MKDFLLISSINAITYKEFFPLLKEGKARGGYTFNKTLMFDTPEGEKSGPNIAWFTSLSTPNKRKLILTKKYHHKLYPHYDNYRAIEVSRIKDIPYDYECVIGCPITIFQYDLDNILVKSDQQPERPLRNKIVIMGMAAGNSAVNGFGSQVGYTNHKNDRGGCALVNGKLKFARVCIILASRKRP